MEQATGSSGSKATYGPSMWTEAESLSGCRLHSSSGRRRQAPSEVQRVRALFVSP